MAALGAANNRQAPRSALSLDHILNEDYSTTN